MESLAGLPDFGTFVSSDTCATFAAFSSGSFSAVAQRATLARDAAGNPLLLLEMFEQSGDFSATGTHAILDLTLGWDYALDAALALARTREAGATVKALAINRGFARLFSTTSVVVPTPDLLAPVELGWLTPDGARWTPRLSAEAGELIKGALGSGSLLLGVRVEFDAIGVAQRTPLTVRFDPSKLLKALLDGRSSRSIAVPDVLAAFTSRAGLPLEIDGTPTPEFAQAMTDRVISSYALLVAAPGVSDPPTVAFADPALMASGTLTWDLSMAASATRQWALELDVASDLRAAVVTCGLNHFVKDIVAPPLQVGAYGIDVTANLPPNRTGVPAIGAYIEVRANPPARPSSINQTLLLSEPYDSARAVLQLSAAEPLAFNVAPYVVVVAGRMVQTFVSPAPLSASASWVTLNASDFPVNFAHVTAADRLIALATLSLELNYTLAAMPVSQLIVLDTGCSSASFAIPNVATGAALQLTATPRDGSTPLRLAPLQPGRIAVDLTLFRGYGPHTITVSAALGSGDKPLQLDVESEEQSVDRAHAPDSLLLTDSQPAASWGYVASSPFHCGFRFRRSATSAPSPAGGWSAFLSPFTPLRLQSDGTPSTLTPGPLAAAQPTA